MEGEAAVSGLEKPGEIFDRDFEWTELTRFAVNDASRATLGIVSGRRRQGKTFLLDGLVRASDGFMFTATETTEADALREFGSALAAHLGEPAPFRFLNWDEAISRLLRIATDGPTVVVLDEFPFLVKASPGLPSLIQRALDPGAQRANTPVRLLLCGSALAFMGKLLAGNAPLRGRAGLELVIATLDFRLARTFWGIDDLATAMLTHCVVGGTPAYRREFAQDDAPADRQDFEPWVCRTVLNPARPLFREARYLLAEEPDLHETALYHATLAAIAAGNTNRGGIASYLARKSTDLAHPLDVLQDAGLITHEIDAFRKNRSAYRIAEPLLAFYYSVMRPAWGYLEHPGRAEGVWRRAQPTFSSGIVGPHFENLCRAWCRDYADPDTLGGYPVRVASGTVSDPAARKDLDVDVAVLGDAGDGLERILAIGEAKWHETMTVGHVRRLERLRDLLRRRNGLRVDEPRLLCFSGSGFDAGLQDLARRDRGVQLIDLDRLYLGD